MGSKGCLSCFGFSPQRLASESWRLSLKQVAGLSMYLKGKEIFTFCEDALAKHISQDIYIRSKLKNPKITLSDIKEVLEMYEDYLKEMQDEEDKDKGLGFFL